MAEIKTFECITIENKDGKRRIAVDGKEMDLSKVVSVHIDVEISDITIETTQKDILFWSKNA